jgi:D-sedoheptulose 7-phosphate isomerase
MMMETTIINFDKYLRSHSDIFNSLDKEQLSKFLVSLEILYKSRGTLWIAGNGGSATTASHASVDFTKTARSEAGSLRAIALSDLIALNTAYSNDISFEKNYELSIQDLAKPGDALMIISVSGLSPNLLNLFVAAKKLKLQTLALVGERGHKIAQESDAGIIIKSNDYQIVENIQLIIIHWLTKALSQTK